MLPCWSVVSPRGARGDPASCRAGQGPFSFSGGRFPVAGDCRERRAGAVIGVTETAGRCPAHPPPRPAPAPRPGRRAARDSNSSSLPVNGCANREPRAVQELALEPVAAGVPYRGSPATGWPIAAKWARIWCVRPVSSRASTSVSAGSTSRTSKCVRAVARPAPADGPPLGRPVVAAERRVDRPRARARPALDQRQVRRGRPRGALIIAERRRCASASRATTISPEVSRSRRWTIPGRAGSPPPSSSPSSVDERRSPGPGRRMDDQPWRLVDHREALVDMDEPRLAAHGSAASGARLRRRARTSAIIDDADGDRDVGEVERRPQRRIEEVGDRALADPVDQVAERASDQQADPEPEPGARSGRRRTSRGPGRGRRA